MRRAAAVLFAALVAGPAWPGISAAWASFDSPAGATASISSAALSAPTSLSSSGTTQVLLTWMATTSTIATGTLVLRGTTPGGPYAQIAKIPGLATTTYTDNPAAGTFYYVVRADESAQGADWTSVNSNQATVTSAVAPTFVKDIGSSSCQVGVSVLSVPTGGVVAGDTVVVSIALRGAVVAGPVAIADAGLNGYRIDADVTNTAGIRTLVLSSHLTTSLAAGAAITVVTPATAWATVSMTEFSHLAAAAVDNAAVNSGTGDTASAAAVVTNAGDLLYAAVGEGNNQGLKYSEAAGWATRFDQETNCGGLAGKLALHTASLPPGALGSFSYSPSTTNGRDWAEAVVAYRAG